MNANLKHMWIWLRQQANQQGEMEKEATKNSYYQGLKITIVEENPY